MIARTTLITPIFLSPKPSSTTSNSVFSALAAAPPPPPAGRGHHHRAAGRRLDAVDVFQVVAQFLGLLEGQADDLLAQLLASLRKTRGLLLSVAIDNLDPFSL